MCIFVHSCLTVRLHVCIHVLPSLHVYLCAFMFNCLSACLHPCFTAWLHVCIHVQLSGCMCAFMFNCLAACVHSCLTSFISTCVHSWASEHAFFCRLVKYISMCNFKLHILIANFYFIIQFKLLN